MEVPLGVAQDQYKFTLCWAVGRHRVMKANQRSAGWSLLFASTKKIASNVRGRKGESMEEYPVYQELLITYGQKGGVRNESSCKVKMNHIGQNHTREQ